jgi:hypothetical protein
VLLVRVGEMSAVALADFVISNLSLDSGRRNQNGLVKGDRLLTHRSVPTLKNLVAPDVSCWSCEGAVAAGTSMSSGVWLSWKLPRPLSTALDVSGEAIACSSSAFRFPLLVRLFTSAGRDLLAPALAPTPVL